GAAPAATCETATGAASATFGASVGATLTAFGWPWAAAPEPPPVTAFAGGTGLATTAERTWTGAPAGVGDSGAAAAPRAAQMSTMPITTPAAANQASRVAFELSAGALTLGNHPWR